MTLQFDRKQLKNLLGLLKVCEKNRRIPNIGNVFYILTLPTSECTLRWTKSNDSGYTSSLIGIFAACSKTDRTIRMRSNFQIIRNAFVLFFFFSFVGLVASPFPFFFKSLSHNLFLFSFFVLFIVVVFPLKPIPTENSKTLRRLLQT